jgi:Etoposide-induced protein 2.4 (EI24)
MTSEGDRPRRPSWWRRFAAGAWHAPGGAVFLLRHPRLWPLAALPALLGAAGLGAGLLLGLYGVRPVEALVAAHRWPAPDLVDLVAVVGLWVGTLASGVLAALALALLVCAPLLEPLGRHAEALAGGHGPTSWPRWRELPATFARALPLLPAVPIGFAASLLPFLGPFLAGLGIADVLAIQQTAASLARRGYSRAARRAWHREWRAESLGFGVASLVLLPITAPILVPSLAIGAALLVHEIEGDAPAVAPAASSEPTSSRAFPSVD